MPTGIEQTSHRGDQQLCGAYKNRSSDGRNGTVTQSVRSEFRFADAYTHAFGPQEFHGFSAHSTSVLSPA
jgi:hypothetical protein